MGMKLCDPNGPLMIFISKMVPAEIKGKFFAFGRVFSGTVFPGQKVRVMGPNYQEGSKWDVFVKTIQKTVVMMGWKKNSKTYVTCGNTVALLGLDDVIKKTCTISNSESAHSIWQMKFSVSPVVWVSIAPKKENELPKLIEGMKKLALSDPLIECIND